MVNSSFTDAIKIELEAIENLLTKVPHNLDSLVAEIIGCHGKVIISGMGKSGIIGKKIAATLASTGTPSFFVHPGEAYHGDLGMIEPDDIVIAISNSGETEEVLRLISYLKENNNTLVAICGRVDSTLVRKSDYFLDVSVSQEACPLALAPTSSTTATLVVGDALAVTLMSKRNFKEENFARYHPGGSLGRRLLTTVADVMKTKDLPLVKAETYSSKVLSVVTSGRVGIALVVDSKNRLLGVITDGDIRRSIERNQKTFFDLSASDIMTKGALTINDGEKLVAAESMMTENHVTTLVAVSPLHSNEITGILQIHDL